MTGDELAAWLASVFPGMQLSLIDARAAATAELDGANVAVTAGFSGTDLGLVLADDDATQVVCEVMAVGDVDKQVLAQAVVDATRELERLGVPGQPGVLLEGLLANAPGTVRHGLLREPEVFAQGTPMVREPGRITLLLELIALTDEEFGIASEQGYPVLERRLRRRGVDVKDWRREEG
ncbi:hypothetical protein [Corynebacterium sp. NML130628]|uniref:hypothetical protein n=1 Tax=Corynebacterium sp. NML130628 TaxID=1906333 RepID=UPI0008FB8DD0|nr:hypothetical protein [Corynebacterium sp. NML130628]OIR44818.1 hypothetical protein BJP07_04980 [Corynebacterium sp. NML130628]